MYIYICMKTMGKYLELEYWNDFIYFIASHSFRRNISTPSSTCQFTTHTQVNKLHVCIVHAFQKDRKKGSDCIFTIICS